MIDAIRRSAAAALIAALIVITFVAALVLVARVVGPPHRSVEIPPAAPTATVPTSPEVGRADR